jgi:FdhE protein
MSGRQDGNAMYGLDEIVARLEALIGKPHVSEGYIRFRIDLLKAQWAVRQALAATPPWGPSLQTTSQATSMAGGEAGAPTPPLGLTTVSFEPELLRSLFTALCASAARRGRQTEDTQRLMAAVEDNPALLEELACKAAFGPAMDDLESLAREVGVFVDVLLFIGRALAAPFVAEAAWRLASTHGGGPAPTATGSGCGMCGSAPSFARLRREDGRRILVCSLCGRSWESPRLLCPLCGIDDPEALSLLRPPEDAARWVEACEGCRGYVKTVDERRLPLGETIIPVVEEAATLHLDLLAEREGYIRRVPYVLAG